MHTITICPRCAKEFMYHSLDYHLHRVVALDTSSGEAASFETICQVCDEIEGISEYIKEKADHRGWENAELMAEGKFGKHKTDLAITLLKRNT